MDTLLELLKDIAHLERAPRTIKGDYPAPRSPYKPVLLLTVLWRIHRGADSYRENVFRFERCLDDFSRLYSSVFGSGEEMEVKATQAFWYLGSGKPKIWNFVAQPGMQESLERLQNEKVQIKSKRKLMEHVAFAQFSDERWKLVSDEDVQRALISFLISEQFTDVRRELEHL